MNCTHLITEVKQQWATLVLGWMTVLDLGPIWDVSDLEFCFCRETFINSSVLLLFLMALQLAPVARNFLVLFVRRELVPRVILT